MNKKNNLNNNEKRNIFNFPEVLNKGTILIILLAYIVIALAAAILFFPEYEYTSVPEYSHTFANQEVSSYFKISTSLIADKSKKVDPKHTLTVYLNNNSLDEEKEDVKVNYEFSGLTNEDTMDYMYSGGRDDFSSMPVVHTLVSDRVVDGGAYKKIFGKIVYKTIGENEEIEEKKYEFSEELLTLSKKEKNSEISNKTMIADYISISVSAIDSADVEYYSVVSSANIKVSTSLYHADYQSWIVTEDGKVYPLVGFYNVSYTGKSTLSSTNKVSTNLNPEYIIIKAVVTNYNGATKTLFYKEKFENIIR